MAQVKNKFYDDILAYKTLLLSACVIGYEERGIKNFYWTSGPRPLEIGDAI
jgi:hypothetical protein